MDDANLTYEKTLKDKRGFDGQRSFKGQGGFNG